jgi:glycosyltransferase involved in cell wall biosynthesis
VNRVVSEKNVRSLRAHSIPLSRQKQVVVIQTTVMHYRVPFFSALRKKLAEENINLRLIHGRAAKTDQFTSSLPWSEPFDKAWTIGKFVYHPVFRPLFEADLLIVEDATKNLTNYLAFLVRFFGNGRIALWGHGQNLQARKKGTASEKLKAWIGKRSDWYFAYTANVKQDLVSRGFAHTRITNVQNATAGPKEPPGRSAIDTLRRKLSIPPDAFVAVYCGNMHPNKQLGLLAECVQIAHQRMPSIRFVLGGGGPDQYIAEELARQYEYVDFVGPTFDKAKSALFGLSHVTLVPGSIGLGILDAFHYSAPPVIVRNKFHSPEIAYLEDNINGLSVDENPGSLAEGICKLAVDHTLYRRLQSGCEETASKITMDAMVERFAGGIVDALES